MRGSVWYNLTTCFLQTQIGVFLTFRHFKILYLEKVKNKTEHTLILHQTSFEDPCGDTVIMQNSGALSTA